MITCSKDIFAEPLQRSYAFFSNRVLPINTHAPRHARPRLFQALVTSTILWSPCCPRQPIMSAHCVFNMLYLDWLDASLCLAFRGKTHKLYPSPTCRQRSGSRATPNFGTIYCWNNGSGWDKSRDYPGHFSAKLC